MVLPFRRTSILLQQRKLAQSNKMHIDFNDLGGWKEFILRYLLQNFHATSPAQDKTLHAQQRALHTKYNKKVCRMSDEEGNHYTYKFAQFVIGRSTLPLPVLNEIKHVCSPLLDGRDPTTDADAALSLLSHVGFLAKGDNLHRVLQEKQISLTQPRADDAAKRCLETYGGTDPWATLRETVPYSVYAIDSASTSEVDDAIGIHTDDKGVEWITVYVADATNYCPIDSELDRVSGQRLGTTTYLSEHVFFMLPRKMVEASTLHPERPCKSFHARFRFDEKGGVVLGENEYTVGVSICNDVKRITYDVCQDIVSGGTSIPSSCPSWMTENDIKNIRRLNELRLVRKQHRTKQWGARSFAIPKPRMYVSNINVLTKPSSSTENDDHKIKIDFMGDESLHLRDAYSLVAEMMIAANEVCSRVAIDNKIKIPFRGTRPLSNRHDVDGDGDAAVLPPGMRLHAKSMPSDSLEFCQAVFDDSQALRGVTRAFYSHEPMYHAGLATNFYSHATSPIRRYADMLLHHQLKIYIAQRAGLDLTSSPSTSHLHLRDELLMAEDCRRASEQQNRSKMLQMNTDRFWVLTHLRNQIQSSSIEEENKKLIRAVVAYNYDITACAMLRNSRARFAAQVYLPDLVITTTMFHDVADLTSGEIIMAEVDELVPVCGILRLRYRPQASQHKKERIDLQSFSSSTQSDL
eukprot:PhM_4_TR13911/c0_g1_i1/m.39860/K01147/rnb; exoribonuclease II